jgi:hypothetical protein
MTGVWIGYAYLGAQSIGVQVLLDERDDLLTGTVLFRDPVTSKFVEAGTVTGTHKRSRVTLTTVGKSIFAGKTEGNRFRGTLTFPAVGTLRRVVAKTTLIREQPVLLPGEVG